MLSKKEVATLKFGTLSEFAWKQKEIQQNLYRDGPSLYGPKLI
jgi:hypothetical protein